MSKEKQNNNLVPELRFPQFNKREAWIYLNGNEVFNKISNKNHNSDLPILAITQEHGAIPRDLFNYNVIVTKKSVKTYKIVEVGDFIISLRSFQGGIELSNYNGICSPAYIILKNKIDISNAFYKHYFKSSILIRDLNKNLEGIRDGKMVSYKHFSDILLPVPKIDEQQKIADFLSSIEELILIEVGKLNTLKDNKKGLMDILFPIGDKYNPDLRFPSHKSTIKWKTVPFNKVFSRIKRKNKENNQNVLTISAQDGLVSQLEYFNKSVSAKDVSGYYLLHKGDFAYNRSYSQGYLMGAIKPLKYSEKGAVSTLYICFRANDGFNLSFLEQYFESGMLNSEIEQIAQEGARNHGLLNISITEFFNNTNLLMPIDDDEQQKIADCLSSIDDLIKVQSKKIKTLKAHKKGLIQQLFPTINEMNE